MKGNYKKGPDNVWTIHLYEAYKREMSARVRRHWKWIKTLLEDSLSPRQRTHLLRRATKDQVLAVSEVVKNLLEGHMDLDPSDQAKLFRYKNAYRRLAQSQDRLPWGERRTLLVKYSKPLILLLNVIKDQVEDLLQ